MPGNSFNMYKTSCLSLQVNGGSNIQLTNIKPDTAQNCRSIYIPAVSGNHCDKNLTKDTCIKFTPGEKICISLGSNGKVRMEFNCTQEHPGSICNDTDLQFHSVNKTWIDALEHCRQENSSLVEIYNDTVGVKVKNLLQNKTESHTGVWVGLERSIFGNNPEWKWISGSKVLYSQWNYSFPVNSLNNHCGKIITVNEAEQIKWLDANCHKKLPFICQRLKNNICSTKAPTLNPVLCIDIDKDSC
ncbi:low affinity immunoglobulin epsilon Fc receptor-like isoform X1 [Astatotilapia calliptera]|uniref:low affinity immunoglobulin epsilon Fc receptor-like isoform X1 n=2 Tax=Astatotilapia calliptera TaxID=8154 RepID=UPI000E4059C0|nr:low affinity immunoglobulin epsilon Fc receptor-like isoform X1 [Astatotilapia calliptera]